MKKMKMLALGAIAFFGIQTTNAQSKVAHVDVYEIMTKMPAIIAAQKELTTLGEGYNKNYTKMVEEYQTTIKKYDAEAATQTDAINQTRQTEVQDMAKRISDFQENAQKDIQKKEADAMKPLQDKVKAAIQKVGKAKGYQYVMDNATLLLSDGPDITADVKKDLGF